MRRSPPEYRGEPGFATWLHRIVTNRCLSLVRARRPAADLDTVEEPADPDHRSSPARATESDVAARDLAQAMDSLFAEQRVCWALRESPHRTPGVENLELPALKGPLCGPEAGQGPGPQTATGPPGQPDRCTRRRAQRCPHRRGHATCHHGRLRHRTHPAMPAASGTERHRCSANRSRSSPGLGAAGDRSRLVPGRADEQ
ncbi:hypothetical protein ACWGK1_20380 [Streptomyces wedmorensis]